METRLTPEDAARACEGLTAYQREAVESGARMTWNNWARQTGKSYAFTLRRVLRGIARRRTQLLVSASERQARELMVKVHEHLARLGDDGPRRRPRERLMTVLPGGARVIVLPANPLTVRGFTGDVLLDEFAMHRDDAAIWAALFPSITRGDGELDVASTPRGRKNTFYRLAGNPRFARSTVTIHAAIAAGLAVDLDALREAMDDPVLFRQEFECEFLDEATAFVPLELIARCEDARLSKRPDEARLARRDFEMYAGVDVGRRRDLTVLWLWERAGDEHVTRGVVELAGAPFVEQRRVLEGLLARPAVRRCCVDATGLGAQLAEELAGRFGEHRVEAVEFTAAVKGELAGRLRVCAERGLLRIPADESIRRDWHSIERVVTTGGAVRYEADRTSGGHADRFWAAALGLMAAGDRRGAIEYVAGPELRFSRAGVW